MMDGHNPKITPLGCPPEKRARPEEKPLEMLALPYGEPPFLSPDEEADLFGDFDSDSHAEGASGEEEDGAQREGVVDLELPEAPRPKGDDDSDDYI